MITALFTVALFFLISGETLPVQTQLFSFIYFILLLIWSNSVLKVKWMEVVFPRCLI